ncbi:7591_t:CDS:2, partial [Paraglomus occultum]
ESSSDNRKLIPIPSTRDPLINPMKKAFEQTPHIDDLGLLQHFEKHIDDCAAEWTEAQHDVYYAPYTVLFQGSGTGKTRLLHQLAQNCFLYTCAFVNLLARDFHWQQSVFIITFS